MKRGQTAWRAFLRTGHTTSSPGPSAWEARELLTRRVLRTRLPDTRCNIACNIVGLATKLCKQAKSFLLRHSIARNIAHNDWFAPCVCTFAIVACNIARNAAEVEASSTSATFHTTIALCLPPATLHAMVWRNEKLLANQISLSMTIW